MTTTDYPRYIIRYGGWDIPGLMNATTGVLKEEFTIDHVSMASGAGVQMTFITCRRAQPDLTSNSKRDKVLLQTIVQNAIISLYEKHNGPPAGKKTADYGSVEVTLVREDDVAIFDIFIELSLIDEIGIIANLTNSLKKYFNLDHLLQRPASLPPDTDPKKRGPLFKLLLQVSPLKHYEPSHDGAHRGDGEPPSGELWQTISCVRVACEDLRKCVAEHQPDICKNQIKKLADDGSELLTQLDLFLQEAFKPHDMRISKLILSYRGSWGFDFKISGLYDKGVRRQFHTG